MDNIFKGLITALITPFRDGKIDFGALKKLLEYQIQNDVDGIIIAGSTGEGGSLDLEEYKNLLQEAVNITDKRVPIIGSCGASSTSMATEISEVTSKAGANGIMIKLPPYVRPTQKGIYEHFKIIHDTINLPIMIYATFGRAGIDVEDETIFELAKLPRIAALKDACANLERPLRISANIKESFNILAGDDSIALAFNAQGAAGCVSAASNITPWLCKELQNHWNSGSIGAALKIHQQLLPIYQSLLMEPNPIGVKYAAYYLGLCENELRLPLIPAQEATRVKIEQAIKLLNE
jgi:4-hydroxy-tetrahydrodipicolinate synthase